MTHPFRCPSVVTWIENNRRRAEHYGDIHSLAAALWREGFDTVGIARRLNEENGWLLTEADVVRALLTRPTQKASR